MRGVPASIGILLVLNKIFPSHTTPRITVQVYVHCCTYTSRNDYSDSVNTSTQLLVITIGII